MPREEERRTCSACGKAPGNGTDITVAKRFTGHGKWNAEYSHTSACHTCWRDMKCPPDPLVPDGRHGPADARPKSPYH